MNKERGGIARQFVLGVVQTADGLPLMHTVHPGNVAETKTLQAMLATVLARFPIQRVILVADRGLLSLDNIGELTALADQDGRRLEFILAVPARRHADLVETFRDLAFDADGLAESSFAGHRLIVAHDPLRAEEQRDKRRARIADLAAIAEKMVGKLDAQDGGQTARGRRASDRGAYSRFTRAVADAEMTRFLKADLNADRFSWSINEDAVARAELFDGKLALITNATDLTPADTVARYKALADIERGFRVLKSDIEIAPVHHRLPDRIRAHALICFLALVLYRVMRMRLKAKGHAASPRTALDLLARIQKHTAHIGNRTFNGTSKTTPEQHAAGPCGGRGSGPDQSRVLEGTLLYSGAPHPSLTTAAPYVSLPSYAQPIDDGLCRRDRRLVDAAAGHESPDDPHQFVRQRHPHQHSWLARGQPAEPRPRLRHRVRLPLDDDAVGSEDQELPEGALAHPGRRAEPLLAPGRVLPRREAEPGGEVAGTPEVLWRRGERSERRSDQRAGPGDRHQPPGHLVLPPRRAISASSSLIRSSR